MLAFLAGWMAATLFTVIAAGAVPAPAAIAASALMMTLFLVSAFAYNRLAKGRSSDRGVSGDSVHSAHGNTSASVFSGRSALSASASSSEGALDAVGGEGLWKHASDLPGSEAALAQASAAMSLEERCELYAKAHRLTPRQGEVCFLLVLGRSVGDIADELYISKDTVKTHVKSLYAKAGVHSHQELISAVYGFEA